MYDLMTLTLVQGHWMTLNMPKNGLLLISRTLFTVESKNLYHLVANEKTFTWMYDMITLTLVQGHWMTLKMWKMDFMFLGHKLQ